MSQAPPDLIAAYLKTEYQVSGRVRCTLKVGEHNTALLALFEAHSVSSAAFITAWNPLSQIQTDDENRAAQKRLLRAIKTLGLTSLDGVGRASDSDWAEDSLLVLGISLEQATALARDFRQHAFVWADGDGIPRLALVSPNNLVFAPMQGAPTC
jgi:hypothetical protein